MSAMDYHGQGLLEKHAGRESTYEHPRSRSQVCYLMWMRRNRRLLHGLNDIRWVLALKPSFVAVLAFCRIVGFHGL
jgi:hypothetical protein